MDNTTAVAYLNRMGGTRSPDLSHCAKQLWLWCRDREDFFQFGSRCAKQKVLDKKCPFPVAVPDQQFQVDSMAHEEVSGL